MIDSVPAKGAGPEDSSSSGLSAKLHRTTVARCRQFLQLQRKDSVPDKMSKLRVERMEAARPKPGELVASKDKKRDKVSDAGEISLSDLMDLVILPILDEIIDGNRMQEYADVVFIDPDLEALEVDEFVAGVDFFTRASKKLSNALANSEQGFSSMITP